MHPEGFQWDENKNELNRGKQVEIEAVPSVEQLTPAVEQAQEVPCAEIEVDDGKDITDSRAERLAAAEKYFERCDAENQQKREREQGQGLGRGRDRER